MNYQQQSVSNAQSQIFDQHVPKNFSILNDFSNDESLDYDIFNNAMENPLNGELFLSKFKYQKKNKSKPTIKKSKSNSPKQSIYQFPIELFNYQNIKGKREFKALMKKQAGQTQYHKGWSINRKKLMNNQYGIYIRCAFCKASINYHQKSNRTWILINYKNNHVHPLSIQNQNSLQIKEIKQNLKTNSNFSQIKNLLKSLDYQYRYQHSKNDISKEGYPQTLVAASLHQKSNYQKYGQCVSYDITYNCIRQKVDSKKLGVGIFSGFDNNNRIIIFGFSITTYETTQHMKNIFSWFFYLMGYCKTTTIITDQQSSIISALKQLKQQQMYKYHHIYDNWHFIRSFILSLKGPNKQMVKQLINKLNKTMRQSDPNVGEYKLNQLKQSMMKENLQRQYKKIEDKIEHVCLWKMPKTFIGLSVHSNQCLNDLLKLKIEQETTLYQVILKFDKVSRQRNQKCAKSIQFEKYPFQTYFDDHRIKQLRQKFQKKVFNTFMYNYNRAQFYKINKFNKENHQYQIQHRIDHDIYHVIHSQCTCGVLEKIGIPCQHIIFLKKVKYMNQSYSQLIFQRWSVPEQKIQRAAIGKKNKK